MLIVLDTNILVSALLTPNGKAYKLLTQVLQGKYKVCLSSGIMDEYRDVLHRDRLGLNKYQVNYLLSWLSLNSFWIEPKATDASRFVMKDETDRKFFDVAKCLNAKLVTGNIKHYPVHELVTSLDELV